MSLTDDLRRLVRAVEAVEEAGGEIEDIDIAVRDKNTGLGSAIAKLSGAKQTREAVFDFRVSGGDISAEELDGEEHRLENAEPAQVDGED